MDIQTWKAAILDLIAKGATEKAVKAAEEARAAAEAEDRNRRAAAATEELTAFLESEDGQVALELLRLSEKSVSLFTKINRSQAEPRFRSWGLNGDGWVVGSEKQVHISGNSFSLIRECTPIDAAMLVSIVYDDGLMRPEDILPCIKAEVQRIAESALSKS